MDISHIELKPLRFVTGNRCLSNNQVTNRYGTLHGGCIGEVAHAPMHAPIRHASMHAPLRPCLLAMSPRAHAPMHAPEVLLIL